MSDTPSLDRVRLRALAEQWIRDWPAIKKSLMSDATLAYVHGMRYEGPSIDFDEVFRTYPLLLDAADERDRLAARVQELERELKGEHALWLNERAISAGRLKALLIKADEARSEWIRAENAEAQLAAALKGSNP